MVLGEYRAVAGNIDFGGEADAGDVGIDPCRTFVHSPLIFFFIGHWRRKADAEGWQADAGHPLLGLFAVSNVSMTLAFAGVCVLAHYWFSGTAQVFVFSALLKLYALKPVYWFVLQFVLMAVAYVHSRGIDGRPSFLFSGSQLRLGVLTAALMQVSLLVLLLSEIGR